MDIDLLSLFVPTPAAASAPSRHGLVRIVPPHRTLVLRGVPGARLTVVAGRLWLTEDGDPTDHFIGAGGRHSIGGRGRVVIECDSMEPAVVLLRGFGRVERAREALAEWWERIR